MRFDKFGRFEKKKLQKGGGWREEGSGDRVYKRLTGKENR
jgi:hypothetical protein